MSHLIDEEWQRSIGFTDHSSCKGPLLLGSVITYPCDGGVEVFLASQRIVLKTREQLLAWLCVRNVPTKRKQ